MGSERTTVEELPCTEDLAQLAATQYDLADRLCDTCRNYHATWPYRRLARVVGATDAGAAAVEAVLAQSFRDGRRRVLIAGAADTGLFALTARAAAGHDVDIVVLDRCRTPLDLCRQFAQRWSLKAAMMHQDLTGLDITADFDVVLANSILPFISPEHRIDVLSRLRRALRPHGCLINVSNAGARVAGEILPEYRARYSGWVLAELERLGIPLPVAVDAFRRQLDDGARLLEFRDGTFNGPDEFIALHERGGFVIRNCVELHMNLVAPWQQFVMKLARRRYMILAEPAATRGHT